MSELWAPDMSCPPHSASEPDGARRSGWIMQMHISSDHRESITFDSSPDLSNGIRRQTYHFRYMSGESSHLP